MKRGAKAQTAVEFIVILAFVLIILIALLSLSQDLLVTSKSRIRSEKAKLALSDISNSAQRVYSQGVGAQEKVFIHMPNGIQQTSVSGKTLGISLDSPTAPKRDVYKNLDFHVVGSLPTTGGGKWVTIKAEQGFVLINYALLDIIPSAVSLQMYPSNKTSVNFTVRNIAQETVNLEVIANSVSGIEMEIPSTFQIAENGSVQFKSNITVLNSTRPGIYQGYISFNATASVQQEHQVPYIIRVPGLEDCTECPALMLYPGFWNAGAMAPGTILNNEFYICNNFDQTLTVDLDFSDDKYLGFDQHITQKTKQHYVFPDDCETTIVYLNTSGSPIEYQVSELYAHSSQASDSSTIYFNVSMDQTPPLVELITPEDNYSSLLANVVFVYNVTDQDSEVQSCKLMLNNTAVETDSVIEEGVNQTFTLFGLTNGIYNWTVNCTDASINGNTAQPPERTLIINYTTVYSTPEIAFEEDYDPQWTDEILYIGDGLEAIAFDEAGPEHGNYPPPDHVEFDFPDLGIGSSYAVEFAQVQIRHYEDLDRGWFDADLRHQVECYNGVEWVRIETYDYTPESNMTYIMYTSPDISHCIYNADIANDAHIRITYDPANDAGASQYIDWVQLSVNISPASYANLWELASDSPYPVDFDSGLNFTDNTFGLGSGDDGWDWQEDVYGGSFSSAEFNVDPNMNGNEQDSTVSSDNRIQVKLGGGARGAPSNPDEGYYAGPITSGAYGVQFEVTEELYNKIDNGGKAVLSFDWEADIDAGWGNPLDSSEEIWVKARLVSPTQTIWLGSDLDSGDGDADSYNEIHFADPPADEVGHENIEITSYITSSGTYYVDLGGALGDWDTDEEGLGVYFDNVMVVFI